MSSCATMSLLVWLAGWIVVLRKWERPNFDDHRHVNDDINWGLGQLN